MNQQVHSFIQLITDNKHINTKHEIINIVGSKFRLVKDGRALYHTDDFAAVFCYSKNGSFSNVVLSLSKLEKYDHIPCFVVLVKKDKDNVIYMLNTSFLDKISHSSQDLSTNNIRGSLLGSNIRKKFDEIGKQNIPDDFDAIFAYHQGFTWQENLERLVESTNNIKPHAQKTAINDSERQNIISSPRRAIKFVSSDNYNVLLDDLRERCEQAKQGIIIASHIDNVNIRGRLIEALITSDPDKRNELLIALSDAEHQLPTYNTKNDIGDYVRYFNNADTYTDIKTKILYLDSNPKAYNIDKFLKCLSDDKSVVMFFFIGIDETGMLKTILCSVFHDSLISSTVLQQHWSGRATRGTAQFVGRTINELLNQQNFINHIDEKQSADFLQTLIDR